MEEYGFRTETIAFALTFAHARTCAPHTRRQTLTREATHLRRAAVVFGQEPRRVRQNVPDVVDYSCSSQRSAQSETADTNEQRSKARVNTTQSPSMFRHPAWGACERATS
jgi:hypothetical protein